MTDDEIRLKIAELKGWTLYDPAKYNGLVFGTAPEGQFYAQPPMWATDISAAWGLVEEMLHYSIKKLGNEVVAVLYPEENILKGVVAKSDTAARAISLAYIALNDSQK